MNTTKELRAAVIAYIEQHGLQHDGECPEDDTCDCELVQRIEAGLAASAATSESEPTVWDDKPDRWTAAIEESFPTRSGSHENYADAMQMVGNRRSKTALVALVNWLLNLRDATHAKLVGVADKLRAEREVSATEMTAAEEIKIWRDWAKENIDFEKFDVVAERGEARLSEGERDRQRVALQDAVDLIREAAPLSWAAGSPLEAQAHAWEKRSDAVLNQADAALALGSKEKS